jgi:hypothetical protein
MALISFTCAAPVASWSPTVNPKRGGYFQGEERYSPTGIVGAYFYSYNHGLVDSRILEWGALPAADMSTLLTFLALMHGGRHTFSFTDYDLTVFTACRVLNFSNLPYKYLTQTLYTVTLELEVA